MKKLLALLLLLAPLHLCAQSNPDGWFTVVLFGDPEINLTDRDSNNATEANIQKWADGIIRMHSEGFGLFSFSKQPEGFTPKADLVICMGDMDGDSETSGTAIKNVFNRFVNAGIPFITMVGNHDIVPDYWNGGDLGVTYGGGANANSFAFNLVTSYLNSAQNNGITDVVRFTQKEGKNQAQPFAFMFRGVRFFIGQTYWFQKTYDDPAFLNAVSKKAAKHYAPNGIISSLTEYVNRADVANTPSVWVQHYPINAADRWWTDENANGATIAPSNTPDYPTAESKRNKYRDLITHTKNPVHFSGHQHWSYSTSYTTNGKTFKDYTAPYFATKGRAYIALCHEGEGVVEVREVCFDYDDPENAAHSTLVTTLDNASNSKIYTLRTSTRGNLFYNGSENYVHAAASTPYNPLDAKQQWAILAHNGARFLYNVSARKFAKKNGDQLALVDTPDDACCVTFDFRNEKTGYPWVLKFGSQYLNLNSGETRGLVVNNWSTLDDGNQFAIAEVGTFDELTYALEKLQNIAVSSTHESRYTSAIKLTTAEGTQTLRRLQSGPQKEIYWDCTNNHFICEGGETLTAAVDYNGQWMNAYVYIDENRDGFSASTNDINATTHRLKTSSAIDLRAYSYYKEYNSIGASTEGNNWTIPSFTAPTNPGLYPMRYKVDWNSICPEGSPTICSNGGIIVDVTLEVKGVEQECSITFINDMSKEKNVVSMSVGVGTSLEDVLHRKYPKCKFVSGSKDYIQASLTRYTIHFTPDYEVKGLADNSHSERSVTSVKLTAGNKPQQTINTDQASTRKVFIDRSTEQFSCAAGEELTAEIDFTSQWMHAYVYIDENYDGFIAKEAHIVNYILQQGEGIDLRSYSCYARHNSLGTSVDENTFTLPPFTAPATPGLYRMRYKVDWNSIDPDGNRTSDEHISNNGGAIIDVMLNVGVSVGIEGLQAAHAAQPASLYTLSGLPLSPTTRLPKGVYILGGRKIVIK